MLALGCRSYAYSCVLLEFRLSDSKQSRKTKRTRGVSRARPAREESSNEIASYNICRASCLFNIQTINGRSGARAASSSVEIIYSPQRTTRPCCAWSGCSSHVALQWGQLHGHVIARAGKMDCRTHDFSSTSRQLFGVDRAQPSSNWH